MLRELPKVIKLFRDHANESQFSLTIDGQEFPWLILESDIHVQVGPNEVPAVTVTLIADRVEVVNDWTQVSDAEKAAVT